MKLDNQLRYALSMIDAFKGDMPLQTWLKNYFRQHPQMGSKDRKRLSEWIFCFYRLGHGFRDLSVRERILTGLFLCNDQPTDLLEYLKPEWNDQIAGSVREKLSFLGVQDPGAGIFPWTEDLSEGIDQSAFSLSHLKQPDLFIRIRPGHEEQVIHKIEQQGWPFERIGAAAVRLPNGTRIEDFLDLNREVVVQDLSSQRVGEILSQVLQQSGTRSKMVWDCCAGSGGKSILLHDLEPSAEITVSDIRPSILANLSKRFEAAGIRNYAHFTADLASPGSRPPRSSYDLILADIPCSGSGTWSRTPDGLYFYNQNQTDRFQALQTNIVSNLIPFLKKGGILVYVSCSVFSKENEMQAARICQEFGLHLLRQQVIMGYEQQADTMYASGFVLE